jgi:hypothetical protein
MKRSFGLWQLVGFSVTSLLGTLLHYLYDISENSPILAPFSGVNESTWEHMKLLFWPMLLFLIFQYFFFRERKDFLCVKLRGMLLGLLLIPIIFYTYNGVIGKSPDWINISIFFIAAATAYIYEYRRFKNNAVPCKNPILPITILALFSVAFVVFTFITPRLGIFKDPLTGDYGI